MHLWPSTKIRDSFKIPYLRNLEWNLERMNSEKKQQSLLDKKGTQENGSSSDTSSSCASKGGCLGKCGFIFKEILMLLSYCFCCGACVDEDEE